jgi:hypothetical protein
LKSLTASSLKNQSEDEESSCDESKNTHGPSFTVAFAAFEIGLEWLDTQVKCCPAHLFLLKYLRNLAAQKPVVAFYLTKNNKFVKILYIIISL